MAIPVTREEFKKYCLRKLGAPVIKINVDDDQLEDRIDEALKYYMDYHFDGSEKYYLKHQVTQTDKDNGYITVPDNIIGVIKVFNIGDPSMRASDMFSIRYQIALNDLYSLTSVSMVPYYLTMTNLGVIQEMLVGKQLIDFNRHTNRIYIRMDWNKIQVGEFLLFECYKVLDPEEYADVWSDRWLQNYTTVLFKEQWGNHLTKYSNMSLTGSVQFNGDRILNDAIAERRRLEDEMIYTFSLPVSDLVG